MYNCAVTKLGDAGRDRLRFGAFTMSTIKGILRRVLSVLSHLPLVGPLVDCRPVDHFETIKQVCVTLLLATAPFSLGSVILRALVGPQITLMGAFWRTVWDGGLFMCATSLLAPIFWIALEDPKGVRKFPSRLALFLVVTMVIAVACVFFSLGLAKSHLDPPYTFHISVIVFWVSVFLLYLSTVYHTNRVNAPEAFREEEEYFFRSYRRHHRE